MVIHKNIRNITDELVEKYDNILDDFYENNIRLRKILKNNLTLLLEEYNNNNNLKKISKVNITICDKKDISSQTEEFNPFLEY